MKSYKQLAEEVKESILIQCDQRELGTCNLIMGSWIPFMERDQETPEEEKKAQYKEMAELMERVMEESEPKYDMGLVFDYIAIRQKLEPLAEGEREAQMLHVTP